MGIKRIWWISALIIIVCIVVLYQFNPESSSLFPKCPFLALTHLKCPGCGSQRAIHCLLHFDIVGAARYNLLLVALMPFLLLLCVAELLRTKCPKFYRLLNNGITIFACLVITVAWWVLRNVFGW